MKRLLALSAAGLALFVVLADLTGLMRVRLGAPPPRPGATQITLVAPAPPPPPPTTCYLRASGNNAVLEVTGVRAENACREWQQWSLNANPDRALAWSETRPALTYADGTPKPDVVKETCRYTLGGYDYSVTDTGGMNIGTGWCQELYRRAVTTG